MKLFGFELIWASATLEAFVPDGTALPHGISRLNPARFTADAIASASFEQAIGLRATLWLIALAPLWLLRRPVTIAGLGLEDRQRVVGELSTSRVYVIRQLTMAIKAMASMLYALSPEARAAMTRSPSRSADSGSVMIRRSKSGDVLVASRKDHNEHAAE
ncbi:MAG TPA: hypothetical protein VM580_23480 [Labilithrix sp.]|nr:hypothetical protein [Labilithrix sp.]